MALDAKFSIREALPSDAESLAMLSTQLGYPATAGEIALRLCQFLSSGGQVVFVAENAGMVVGFVTVALSVMLVEDTKAQVTGLVVDEMHRSAGVGRLLLERAEAWARSCGCLQLQVWSNIKRERAHEFYRRQGYAVFKTSLAFAKEL